MKNLGKTARSIPLKISLLLQLLLLLVLALQLARATAPGNSTAEEPAKKQDDLVAAGNMRPAGAGRAGRMLDLDVMAGELGKEAKAAQERARSGDRQSRMLLAEEAAKLAAGGQKVEGRSPKKGGGKKMSIKGFIPIMTLDGKHNFEGLDTDADSPADDTESEPAEQQQQQQQQANQLREHLANSFGGQTSLGHASFGQQPSQASGSEWQQPAANYNGGQWDQMAPASESGARATRKLLGSSGLLSGLTGGAPGKRGLVSSLVPTAFNHQQASAGGFSAYNPQQQQQALMMSQLGGPMNLPAAAASQTSGGAGDDCICVPFFQCKNGYLSESQLSKGQLLTQPANHQIPRSLSDFKPAASSSSDLYYSQPSSQNSEQQQQQQQQQQQLVNEMIYEQLKRSLEGANLEQQLQQQQAYQQANQQHLALLDERSNGASGNSSGSSPEERSLLAPLASRRQQFQLPSSRCGIMRTCCRLPPRTASVRGLQQQPAFSLAHPARMGALSSASRFAQSPYLPQAQPMQQPQPMQQLLASPSIGRPQTHYQMLQPARQQPLTAPTVMQDFYSNSQQQQLATDAYPPMAGSQVAPVQQQQLAQVFPVAQRPPGASFMQGRCGQRQTLGISGRVQNAEAQQAGAETSADFGEFPAHAAILKRLSPGDSLFVCSAVLVSSQWLATAAHCVRKTRPDELKVRLGEWDVQRDDEFYPFFESNVREIHLHPDFQPSSLINDIALLRLEQPVDQQQMPHIAPACLPSASSSSSSEQPNEPAIITAQSLGAPADFAGQRCWVAGWGKDAFGQQGAFQSVLKKVDLPVVGRAECEQALRYQTKLGKHFRLHASNICAGGERGKDACEGDGGAGLYCLEPASQLIKAVGLVSWGVGCGQRGVPGVYVSLAHFGAWIERVVASSGEADIYMDARANQAGAASTGLDAQTFKSIISERNSAPSSSNATLADATPDVGGGVSGTSATPLDAAADASEARNSSGNTTEATSATTGGAAAN